MTTPPPEAQPKSEGSYQEVMKNPREAERFGQFLASKENQARNDKDRQQLLDLQEHILTQNIQPSEYALLRDRLSEFKEVTKAVAEAKDFMGSAKFAQEIIKNNKNLSTIAELIGEKGLETSLSRVMDKLAIEEPKIFERVLGNMRTVRDKSVSIDNARYGFEQASRNLGIEASAVREILIDPSLTPEQTQEKLRELIASSKQESIATQIEGDIKKEEENSWATWAKNFIPGRRKGIAKARNAQEIEKALREFIGAQGQNTLETIARLRGNMQKYMRISSENVSNALSLIASKKPEVTEAINKIMSGESLDQENEQALDVKEAGGMLPDKKTLEKKFDEYKYNVLKKGFGTLSSREQEDAYNDFIYREMGGNANEMGFWGILVKNIFKSKLRKMPIK